MLRFICFGSGSSGNCYYLNADGYGLLIDLGIGLRSLKKYIRNYGLSFGEINAIFVTHDHTDHVKSVGAFSGEFNIPVYALQSVHEGMQRNYFMSKKIIPDNKRILNPDTTILLEKFKITPFNVPHDSSANCGYFIEVDGITFCLVTDMGHVTDDIRLYIEKSRYVVVEANYDAMMLKNGPYPAFLKRRIMGREGHMDNLDTAELLSTSLSAETRNVWLCHLSEENNHPELARKTVETALFDAGKWIPGGFLKIDVLKRKVPSLLYELD